MKKQAFDLFAVVSPGLENACAAELRALDLAEVCPCRGGVAFRGGHEALYMANLWSRLATRILVRLGEFRCSDFPSLYRKALRLPWGRFLKPGTPLNVRAASRRSRLQHTGRMADTIRQAAMRSLGGASAEGAGEAQTVLVRCEDDGCQISVDSSGALLHRRGYRQSAGAAPLRETLAAGILSLLGWRGDAPLVDPMCGSGTFVIEAAMMAKGQAPGSGRPFAFMQWPRYRAGLWQVLQARASSGERAVSWPLIGRDRDAAVIEAAAQNAARAKVADEVLFEAIPLGQGAVPPQKGWVICNPPYGGRLGRESELTGLYRRLGDVLRSQYGGWTGAVLCPPGKLVDALGGVCEELALLDNGGLEVGLFRLHL